jgi:hypothetical protein
MNDLGELQSARTVTTSPCPPTPRLPLAAGLWSWCRWCYRIATFGAMACGGVWVIGLAASNRMEKWDLETVASSEDPAPGLRHPRAVINNMISSKGWVPNLDGTAVAYAAEADGLISDDGRFRTDLGPREVAGILHLDVDAIIRAGSPHEIDSNAVLFRAQAGTLTESTRAACRKRRLEQVAQGLNPDAAFRDWNVRAFAFTIDRLQRPNVEEKVVLSAIARSKLLVVPRPGDSIRAVAVDRGELEFGKVALWPGMLPPEIPLGSSNTQ